MAGNPMQIKQDFQTQGEGAGWLEVWDDKIDAMNQILDAIQPDQVETASKRYGAVATRMSKTVDDLYKHAQTLSEHWGGDDADKAMKQMQKMYTQAQQIQTVSDQTNWTLGGHAETLRQYKDPSNRPQGAGAIETGVAVVAGGLLGAGADRAYHNKQAANYLNALQNAAKTDNSTFPKEIVSDQASADFGAYTPIDRNGPDIPHVPGGGGGGHIPSGGSGHIPNTGSGHIPNTDNGHIPTTHDGHLPPGTGHEHYPGSIGGGHSKLAGFDPGGGGGGGLGGGGLGGGGLGGDPLGGGGLSGAGAGGLSGAGAGGLGSGAGAGAAGAGGRGMMPMAPGGHGQGEKERERSTWLTEDEDVWGSDGDAAPPLIG